ncbi:MAG TPA: TolC family protein [Rectinemataceae bacterium]|nr:TolC family protein [Rectinemataceae bacterium]
MSPIALSVSFGRRLRLGAALPFFVLLFAVALPAAPQAAAAAPAAVSLDQAVTTALATDPGLEAAALDRLSALAKADSARWRRLPSLSASAGYQRLSDLSSSMNLGPLGTVSFSSLDNQFAFGVSMQYPIFAGFRTKENIAIAGLQAEVKDVAVETGKRALVFQVQKAYWEAVRATHNRATLEQNLTLMKENSSLTARQVGEGVATQADQLASQMRLEQATQDLNDARALQRNAFLVLASLMGMDLGSLGISTAAPDAALPFSLITGVESQVLPDAATRFDEAALISKALARRPETRTAQLARAIAEHSVKLSRAALYPTVALTGNFSYADPNQRVAFQSDPWLFTGTWALGLQISYDVGALPAAMDDIKAQGFAASKAKADETRQRMAVVMDVETSLVNLERAMRDLATTEAMVAQAQENLRVMQGRVAAGTAKDIDLASAQFDLLRTDFAVTNRRIDVLIAQADLDRATAASDLQ